MSRKSLYQKPMTPAERQRRHRAKTKRELLKLGSKAERQRRLAKAAEQYIPMPPGVTYWREVTVVTPEGERTVWNPHTQPLAAVMAGKLSAAEIVGLIQLLQHEQERRQGGRKVMDEETVTDLLTERPGRDTCVTVGPR